MARDTIVFRPLRAATPPVTERRTSVRHSVHLKADCRPLTNSTGLNWTVTVRNLSIGGLAIIVPRKFDMGTVLNVTLRNANGVVVTTKLVRIRHLRQENEQEWLYGCAFAKKLSDEELEWLL